MAVPKAEGTHIAAQHIVSVYDSFVSYVYK